MATTPDPVDQRDARIKRTPCSVSTEVDRLVKGSNNRRQLYLDGAAFETSEGQNHSATRGIPRDYLATDF